MSDEHASGLTFTSFVISLATTAAVRFGDIPDPATGHPQEPDPQAAAHLIAILALLDEKTRGNLTAQERSLLEQVLYELRLRFVAATTGRQAPMSPDQSG